MVRYVYHGARDMDEVIEKKHQNSKNNYKETISAFLPLKRENTKKQISRKKGASRKRLRKVCKQSKDTHLLTHAHPDPGRKIGTHTQIQTNTETRGTCVYQLFESLLRPKQMNMNLAKGNLEECQIGKREQIGIGNKLTNIQRWAKEGKKKREIFLNCGAFHKSKSLKKNLSINQL